MSKDLTRLSIDIGGTNIRLGLLTADSLSPQRIGSYRIDDYSGPAEVIAHYLQQTGQHALTEAAIAVATPVEGDRIKLTNHDWNFLISDIHREFGFQRIKVVNDFTALALSLPWLEMTELQQVGGIAPAVSGPMALLGAGTGLGVSGLVATNEGYYPLSGEGGHVTLGARNARELAIFQWFLDKYGHMSAERLLSGTGLTEFYQVIRRLDGQDDAPLLPEEISPKAISGECASCVEVMTLFCEWFGIVAGNLALTLGATGGVYIGGGIVPKLGDYFLDSAFRTQFESKGRHTKFVQQIPVYVIHADNPALRGAAYALDQRFELLGETLG